MKRPFIGAVWLAGFGLLVGPCMMPPASSPSIDTMERRILAIPTAETLAQAFNRRRRRRS